MPVVIEADIHEIDIVFALHEEELDNEATLAAVRERIARAPQEILRVREREMQGDGKGECRLLRRMVVLIRANLGEMRLRHVRLRINFGGFASRPLDQIEKPIRKRILHRAEQSVDRSKDVYGRGTRSCECTQIIDVKTAHLTAFRRTAAVAIEYEAAVHMSVNPLRCRLHRLSLGAARNDYLPMTDFSILTANYKSI